MSRSGTLNIPDYTPKDFKQNLIKTAVCELRYPVLLELESSPPVKFQSAIRKAYPHYERRVNFKLNVGTEPTQEPEYHFISVRKDWSIRVTSASISLETAKYSSFTEFVRRLKDIVGEAKKFIDSPMFTRVGLRYIDFIEVPDGKYTDWINKELVLPLTTGSYGEPELCWQTIRGTSDAGRFTFQHGIRQDSPGSYILDFDFFEEDVEIKSIENVLRGLHKESLKLFFWSIGQKSLEKMEAV